MRSISAVRRLAIGTLVFAFWEGGAFAQFFARCDSRQVSFPKTKEQVFEFFSSTPVLELGTAQLNPSPNLSNSQDSVWAGLHGDGRLHSAAYAGKAGTKGEGLYLYLYRVESLGGTVSNPDFMIPQEWAALRAEVFGWSFIEIVNPSARQLPGNVPFPPPFDADTEVEGLEIVRVENDLFGFSMDTTGVFRSSNRFGFVSDRAPISGFGLIQSATNFGTRAVAAVTPSSTRATNVRLTDVRGSASELLENARALLSLVPAGQPAGQVAAMRDRLDELKKAAEAASTQRELQYLEMELLGFRVEIEEQIQRLAWSFQTPSTRQQLLISIEYAGILLRRGVGEVSQIIAYASALEQTITNLPNASADQKLSWITQLRNLTSQMNSFLAAMQQSLASTVTLKTEVDSMASITAAQMAAHVSMAQTLRVQAAVLQFRGSMLIENVRGLYQLIATSAPVSPPPRMIFWDPCRMILQSPAIAEPLFQSSVAFTVPASGGLSIETTGMEGLTAAQRTPERTTGYGRITSSGPGTVAGIGFVSSQAVNADISQIAIAAKRPLRSGRLHVRAAGAINTAIAILNPQSEAVSVTFYMTNEAGGDFAHGGFNLAANSQKSVFVTEPPFNAPFALDATLTINASAPIGITALRGTFTFGTSRRFLISPVPVVDLGEPNGSTAILNQFVDGGGWTTDVAMVNPTGRYLSGSVEFWTEQSALTVSYSLAPRAHQIIRPPPGNAMRTGFVRVVPAVFSVPATASLVVSSRRGEETVSEHTVTEAQGGSSWQMFAQSSGEFGKPGSMRSGVAVTNASGTSATIQFEIVTLAGNSTGFRSSVTLGGGTQISSFLHEIPGFESLPDGFHGIVRITRLSGSQLFVSGFRGQYGQRGGFVMTGIPLHNEIGIAGVGTDLILPVIAFGPGFSTQFVVLSNSNEASTGNLSFHNPSGAPLEVPFGILYRSIGTAAAPPQ